MDNYLNSFREMLSLRGLYIPPKLHDYLFVSENLLLQYYLIPTNADHSHSFSVQLQHSSLSISLENALFPYPVSPPQSFPIWRT